MKNRIDSIIAASVIAAVVAEYSGSRTPKETE